MRKHRHGTIEAVVSHWWLQLMRLLVLNDAETGKYIAKIDSYAYRTHVPNNTRRGKKVIGT